MAADPTHARLRLAVVDDEPLARRVVSEYLADVADVEIVAECANGFEAVKAVAELRPDVLLLDVQMPKLDGFEVVDLVGRDVAVVFLTAYDQYAIKAFDVAAVDYLLKPFTKDRLLEALARVRARGAAPPGSMQTVATVARGDGAPHATRIAIRDGAKVHVLPVEKIDYVQAQDDYVSFRSEGREYLKEQPLGDVESSLDPARFVRIHRSFLLNIDRLARVELDDRENRVATLLDGRRLPVSRAGYVRLTALLEK